MLLSNIMNNNTMHGADTVVVCGYAINPSCRLTTMHGADIVVVCGGTSG